MNRAVFFDRDGVINPLVYNTKTSEYESPHYPEDFSVYPDVLISLKILMKLNYRLFIVSNQPSYAKGKTTLENIQTIELFLSDYLSENGVVIDKYYYCYHHPDGIIDEYAVLCKCRKPGILFLEDAVDRYDLNVNECWFIGDRDTDIICGKSMGMKTILIKNKHSENKAGKEIPDEAANNIKDAVNVITKEEININ